ncbi:HPr family phosphocarrier protein [Acaricomes phytoseiuli]|uniref:HPr family phosphocarrier protein n=1 Tax=Acaricomes phytoseiuli TaxID=291968 RepID=UPI00035D6C02|nr:HPr family phosphocarrier protein [Acaricomes phytoseiuli]MCW1249219.1 HPr family phosphocarrier protein [Acaricomes phytoseiuli]
MTVTLIIVAHSTRLAEGVAELVSEMAPQAQILPAGGDQDGSAGISRTKVAAAVEQAGGPVLLLTDVGPAAEVAEAVLAEVAHPELAQLAQAPLVEGAVAAALQAQSGGSLAEVRQAAESALWPEAWPIVASQRTVEHSAPQDQPRPRKVSIEVVLVNPLGLHARPAATLAAALSALDTDIEINGVDGQSVMMLMSLGAQQGSTLKVTARGPDAQRAVELVHAKVTEGFGEI